MKGFSLRRVHKSMQRCRNGERTIIVSSAKGSSGASGSGASARRAAACGDSPLVAVGVFRAAALASDARAVLTGVPGDGGGGGSVSSLGPLA